MPVPENILPVTPFIFRYRVFAPKSTLPGDTDQTAGYQTPYVTNDDSKDKTDYAEWSILLARSAHWSANG